MTWLKLLQITVLSSVLFLSGVFFAQTPQLDGQKQDLLAKALSGDADSQYKLGLLYVRGSAGAPMDYSKAVEWFRRSAEKGDPKGENALGVAYAHGFGVVKDEKVGFNLFYKAALKGNAAAQHNLAKSYSTGRGTPKNESAAFDWSLKAALNGQTSSQLLLCDIYQKVTSGEWDPTLAYSWCLIAQESEHKQTDPEKKLTDKQRELLGAYTNSVHGSLLPAQLQEATSLASNWNVGHSSGVTMPRHSQYLLATMASPPVAEGATKGIVKTKKYLQSNGCETGHWVASVLSDGEIVKLEDGTTWKIDDADTIDSILWLVTDDITVCNGKLVNTDDESSVGAHEVHR